MRTTLTASPAHGLKPLACAIAIALLNSTAILHAASATGPGAPTTPVPAPTATVTATNSWIAKAATTKAQLFEKTRVHVPSNAPSGPPVGMITELGPHHRIWATGPTNPAPNPLQPGAQPHAGGFRLVKELATGMNYWDGNKWTPSDPTFVATADGFAAMHVQDPVHLAANLNVKGAVSVTTPAPDLLTLQSTPVAIGLYDAASGQFVTIGTITNCAGTLVRSNQVLYEDAFAGVSASVLYTLARGSFQQDVVLNASVDPADYGLPRATTRLQIITEFFNPPEPRQVHHALRAEKNAAVRSRMASPDFEDNGLGFGKFVLGKGYAFALTNTNGSSRANPGRRTGAPVGKEFTAVGSRRFLVVWGGTYVTLHCNGSG